MIKLKNEQAEVCFGIGKVVVSLSKLEHLLASFLEVLADAEESIWIKPFFIDDIMAGRILTKVSGMAKVRLKDNPPLWEQLRTVISDIRTLQEERNKVVHGEWLFNERCPIKLRTYKLRWESGCWQYLVDTVMTLKELDDMAARSEKLEKELQELIPAITNSQ